MRQAGVGKGSDQRDARGSFYVSRHNTCYRTSREGERLATRIRVGFLLEPLPGGVPSPQRVAILAQLFAVLHSLWSEFMLFASHDLQRNRVTHEKVWSTFANCSAETRPAE